MPHSTDPASQRDAASAGQPEASPTPSKAATALRRFAAALLRIARPRLFVALAAVVVALGAAIAPWTFSNEALFEEVAGQLRSSFGLYVAAKGRSTFSLLPRPHIAIASIAFGDPLAALTVHADDLYGNVRILPLFAGRLEIAEVTLARPQMVIDLDRKPMSAAGAAVRAAATRPATPEAEKADRARLGVVSIVAGAARVKYGGGRETVLENIDATLDWRTVGSAATFAGAFSWRSERPQVMVWIAQPGALLRGNPSPVTTRIDSERIHVAAEGMGEMGATPRFTGQLTASSPSLRQSLDLMDISVPLPGPFENVRLTCQLTAETRDFQLSNLRFLADDNEFEGSFALRHDADRPIVQATLASNFVSLKPLVADTPPLASADRQWSRDVFDLPDLAGADVDLRLSAARARLGRLDVDDAALSLMLRGGRLEITLAEAQAYMGTIKARATFAAVAAGGLEFHANAQTTGVDAGALSWDLAARQDISGNLDASVTLDAAGDSVAQLTRELGGRASFALTQGEIAGIDLERALRRLDKRPLSSAFDITSGRTAFDKVSATIKIAKGTASIEDGAARGPGFSLAFAGSTRIPDRSLALKAQANEADASGKPRDKGVQIGFDIAGSW
ncbi:MAG: AsmA family protein, partial [Methylocystis sp.]|nr:AsmA family protein [Methylocystis sp.]